MRVRVKYFGRFAVNIGKFSEEIEVPEGITVGKFIEILRSRYRSFKNEEIEISIGGKYARKDEPLGNEVAVYPVISGG